MTGALLVLAAVIAGPPTPRCQGPCPTPAPSLSPTPRSSTPSFWKLAGQYGSLQLIDNGMTNYGEAADLIIEGNPAPWAQGPLGRSFSAVGLVAAEAVLARELHKLDAKMGRYFHRGALGVKVGIIALNFRVLAIEEHQRDTWKKWVRKNQPERINR